MPASLGVPLEFDRSCVFWPEGRREVRPVLEVDLELFMESGAVDVTPGVDSTLPRP